jgi:hypothetical protein
MEVEFSMEAEFSVGVELSVDACYLGSTNCVTKSGSALLETGNIHQT